MSQAGLCNLHFNFGFINFVEKELRIATCMHACRIQDNIGSYGHQFITAENLHVNS